MVWEDFSPPKQIDTQKLEPPPDQNGYKATKN